MKWVLVLSLWSIFSLQNNVLAQELFQCPVCGEGKEMTIPDGTVTVPQNGEFECAQLVRFADQGTIDRQTCALVEPFVQEPCGCIEALVGNATEIPTEVATASPTGLATVPPTGRGPETETTEMGPESDCFDDLDEIRQLELDLSEGDIAIGRTYVLCPDTVFLIGILQADGTFAGGFAAITPRPNVHYKCGTTGSSANNCRLLGGSSTIISYGGDPQHTNVTFEGLTIESAKQSGVVAATPGDLTFKDCIFKVTIKKRNVAESSRVIALIPLSPLHNRITKILDR
jgi:hypothetical protein